MEKFEDQGNMKPVPIPRSRLITSQAQDAKNNNGEGKILGEACTKNKPVPLPRKFLNQIRTFERKNKETEATLQPVSEEAKRGTINIFKRGRAIDPFEEFEAEFKGKPHPHLLSAVSFASPLEDLSAEAKARLSSLSSNSSSTNQSSSDSSDYYYDQPQALAPSAISPTIATTVPKKPERRCYMNVTVTQPLDEDNTYESLAPPPPPTAAKILKPVRTSLIGRGSKNVSSTTTTRSSAGEISETQSKLMNSERNSFSSNGSSVHDESVTLRRNVNAHRSSEESNSSTSSKVDHAYDHVAVEDGTVVFLDNQLNTKEKGVGGTRDSVVMEFDPLLIQSHRELPKHHSEKILSQLIEETEVSESPVNRYEFIQPEERALSFVNPNYIAREHGTQMGTSSNLYEDPGERAQIAPVATVEENYEDVNAVVPSEGGENEGTKKEVEVHPSVSNLKRSEGSGSFLRRLSHKIRLIPIREETRASSVESLSSTNNTLLQARCEKCQGEHAEGSKCKFNPVARQNIVYSSYLYRPSGIVQKEYTKRWAVLAKGKLIFYNEKSVVLEEISLERGILLTKKSETRPGPGGAILHPFEIQFASSKKDTLQLAGTTESERAQWMQKLIEAFTSVFPAYLISSFDRAGWVFIKESVTSNWHASWLILRGRTLLYSFAAGEEFSELDLRKARSVLLSTKDLEQKCPHVENSDVLTVDIKPKILFIQTEATKVTAGWEKVIAGAAKQNGIEFSEMQLTVDDVPVIVDKCIDFLYAHGTLSEGIYRQSGSNTRITHLLSEFQKDSWAVSISHKEFSAHDVAGTLKRFFRTLPQPLLTTALYKDWICASKLADEGVKNSTYEKLLNSLPPINYNILKKLICHLYAIHELHEKNLMPDNNLAPIWGPTLMNVESSLKSGQTSSESDEQYRSACSESEVIKDLIRHYYTLFRVDAASREKERKMQDALENFHIGAAKRKCSGDMRVWIYLWEKDESNAIHMTLTPQGTAHSIVQQLCRKAQLRNYDNLSLHEVICGKSLERPLHPSEIVIETVLRWSIWDVDERKDNYLILQKNTLYPALIPFAKDPIAVYGNLKFADSRTKTMKKYAFEFSRAMLKYYKDSKATVELGSWKIEDIVWYMGCEPKRSERGQLPRWAFTFVKRNYPFKRSREEPFFGNVVSCSSEEELHKWVAAMVVGEHPAGLYPSVIV